MPFYAVARGRKVGVYQNWAECQENVTGFSNASFKRFDSSSDAWAFVKSEEGKPSTQSRASKGTSADANEPPHEADIEEQENKTHDDDGELDFIPFSEEALFRSR